MIYFRKPLIIMSEKNEGYIKYAFVLWGRRPCTWNTRHVPDAELSRQGFSVMSEVVQYKYVLIIDLWLCALDFRWYGRVKEI